MAKSSSGRDGKGTSKGSSHKTKRFLSGKKGISSSVKASNAFRKKTGTRSSGPKRN